VCVRASVCVRGLCALKVLVVDEGLCECVFVRVRVCVCVCVCVLISVLSNAVPVMQVLVCACV